MAVRQLCAERKLLQVPAAVEQAAAAGSPGQAPLESARAGQASRPRCAELQARVACAPDPGWDEGRLAGDGLTEVFQGAAL